MSSALAEKIANSKARTAKLEQQRRVELRLEREGKGTFWQIFILNLIISAEAGGLTNRRSMKSFGL